MPLPKLRIALVCSAVFVTAALQLAYCRLHEGDALLLQLLLS